MFGVFGRSGFNPKCPIGGFEIFGRPSGDKDKVGRVDKEEFLVPSLTFLELRPSFYLGSSQEIQLAMTDYLAGCLVFAKLKSQIKTIKLCFCLV